MSSTKRLCENVPNQRPDRCEFLKPKKVRTKVTTTAPINRRKRSLSFIMPPTMAAFSLGLQQPPAKKKVSSPLPASKSTSKKKTCSRKPTPEKNDKERKQQKRKKQIRNKKKQDLDRSWKLDDYLKAVDDYLD